MGRVLIVDDSRELLDLLSTLIVLLGHEPRVALNGSEALAIIQADDIDLVLLDLMMPILDGYETLYHLRAMERGLGLPVVIVTASADPDVESRTRAAGANDLVHKPFEMSALEAIVEKYLIPSSSPS
jgi:CheY-like chemotaxis protein